MRIYRTSGVRLDPKSHMFAAQFETIVQQSLKLGLHVFQEAQKEPFLFYDNEKTKPIYQLIQGMLLQGELFFAEVDGEIIGYAAFRNIQPNKCANLEIFLLPKARRTRHLGTLRTVLEEAAFSPFPAGLELLKLKASISPGNHSSLRACKNSGFVALCDLPLEGLFLGQLSTMIYLEHYSPEIRALQKPQEISNGKQPINPSNPVILKPSKLQQPRKLQRRAVNLATGSTVSNSELPERVQSSKPSPRRRRSPRTAIPISKPGDTT